MFGRIVSAAAFAAISASPTFAETLQPTGKWLLDYREDQCLASRDYGRPEKPITLGIRPSPDGENYELLVALPRSGPEFATELKGSVNFGHGPIKAWLLSYGGKNSSWTVHQFRISAAEMAQANSAATVTVKSEGTPDVTFSLQSMPALLKGLQDCIVNLQRYWNVGGVEAGSIATRAKGDVRSIFSADDYPADAVQNRQGGRSQFLLLIDEKGNVAGCNVLVPSGIPVLDAMGCQVIRQRAKFTPAKGRDGKPVRDAVVTPPVAWRISG